MADANDTIGQGVKSLTGRTKGLPGLIKQHPAYLVIGVGGLVLLYLWFRNRQQATTAPPTTGDPNAGLGTVLALDPAFSGSSGKITNIYNQIQGGGGGGKPPPDPGAQVDATIQKADEIAAQTQATLLTKDPNNNFSWIARRDLWIGTGYYRARAVAELAVGAIAAATTDANQWLATAQAALQAALKAHPKVGPAPPSTGGGLPALPKTVHVVKESQTPRTTAPPPTRTPALA